MYGGKTMAIEPEEIPIPVEEEQELKQVIQEKTQVTPKRKTPNRKKIEEKFGLPLRVTFLKNSQGRLAVVGTEYSWDDVESQGGPRLFVLKNLVPEYGYGEYIPEVTYETGDNVRYAPIIVEAPRSKEQQPTPVHPRERESELVAEITSKVFDQLSKKEDEIRRQYEEEKKQQNEFYKTLSELQMQHTKEQQNMQQEMMKLMMQLSQARDDDKKSDSTGNMMTTMMLMMQMQQFQQMMNQMERDRKMEMEMLMQKFSQPREQKLGITKEDIRQVVEEIVRSERRRMPFPDEPEYLEFRTRVPPPPPAPIKLDDLDDTENTALKTLVETLKDIAKSNPNTIELLEKAKALFTPVTQQPNIEVTELRRNIEDLRREISQLATRNDNVDQITKFAQALRALRDLSQELVPSTTVEEKEKSTFDRFLDRIVESPVADALVMKLLQPVLQPQPQQQAQQLPPPQQQPTQTPTQQETKPNEQPKVVLPMLPVFDKLSGIQTPDDVIALFPELEEQLKASPEWIKFIESQKEPFKAILSVVIKAGKLPKDKVPIVVDAVNKFNQQQATKQAESQEVPQA
jgi:hypothetical protein